MSCRPKSCQTYVIFMHYVISSCNSTSYCDFRIRKNICCSLRIQLCSFLYCMQLFFIMCDTFTLLISVLHFSLQCSHFVFSFISCHVVCYWSDITSCRLLLFFIEQHFSLQFYTSHSSVLISCSMFSFCVLIQIGIVLRIVTLVSEKKLSIRKKNPLIYCSLRIQLCPFLYRRYAIVLHMCDTSFTLLISVSHFSVFSFIPCKKSCQTYVIFHSCQH